MEAALTAAARAAQSSLMDSLFVQNRLVPPPAPLVSTVPYPAYEGISTSAPSPSPRLRPVRGRKPTPGARRSDPPLPPVGAFSSPSSVDSPGGTRAPVVLPSGVAPPVVVGKRLPSIEITKEAPVVVPTKRLPSKELESSSEDDDSSFHPSEDEEAAEAFCKKYLRKKRVKRPSPSSSSSSSDEE